MIAPIAVLDACVLYPVVVRDLLLTMSTNAALDPRWSAEILDEMRRNVLADHPEIDPVHFETKLIGAMTRRSEAGYDLTTLRPRGGRPPLPPRRLTPLNEGGRRADGAPKEASNTGHSRSLAATGGDSKAHHNQRR